ncbi:MAG TPA: hypothetical protein VMD91_03340 [Candidatus Sulfotelmatobacter sp.]|nr:hypothetical protein [Candidatus Sulfotelmatobacter sp.]
MAAEEAAAFRAFLREGLSQYQTTPARVGRRFRKTPTAQDLHAVRIGIQSDHNPLRNAGYRTAAQIGKLVENSLGRAVPVATARLALHALETSAVAASWRRVHGWDADRWYARLIEHRKATTWADYPEWPKEQEDPLLRATAAIHPNSVDIIAQAVVRDLYNRKILRGPQRREAERIIAAGLRERQWPWLKGFTDWLRMGGSMFAVDVVEENHKSVPEGADFRQATIRLRRRDGEPVGRPATHHEFVEGLLGDQILRSESQRRAATRPRTGSKR